MFYNLQFINNICIKILSQLNWENIFRLRCFHYLSFELQILVPHPTFYSLDKIEILQIDLWENRNNVKNILANVKAETVNLPEEKDSLLHTVETLNRIAVFLNMLSCS